MRQKVVCPRFLAVVFCALVLPLMAAQAPRPKVGLVLSGGGARGLAHIGVLKVLRDMRVPVDFIVATSMGSIVGGSYAAGHTPEEMERMLEKADWELLFSDRPPREHLSFRRKDDDLRLIGTSEVGIKRDGLTFPRGVFGSQNLEEFLRELALPAAGARTLNDLPLLFRSVATDLETGRQVVLSEVSLPTAMRASMSIPGAFAPTEVDGRLLADGGLVRNLPVEVAREMGADVIIAVNVGTPLLPRAALGDAFGVAQQMINVLTEQNVGISLAALRPQDVLISPDLKGVSFIDFEKGKELVARGEAAGRDAASRLAALAVEPAAYALFESHRTRRPPLYDRPVARIDVTGTRRSNPEALLREASRAGIEPGKAVTDQQLVEASRIVYGMGEFERAEVRAHLEEGRKIVVIDVDEKPWGPDYLRFAGRAVSDFETDGRFSAILQHTRTWLNSWGAEWVNELQFGDVRRIRTGLYQPLGPGSPWFVEAGLQTAKSNSDVFAEDFRRTDRLTNSAHTALAGFGYRLGNVGVATLHYGYEHYKTTPLIGTGFPETTKDRATFGRLSAVLDTLDDANFPRRGYLLGAFFTRHAYRTGDKPRIESHLVQGILPWTTGRLTLLGLGTLTRASDERSAYPLGGFLSLSGTPIGAIAGPHTASMALLGYYRIGELPRAAGRGIYAGVSVEAGNAWQRRSDMSFGDMRKAGSIFLGLDSLLGGMYFAYGYSEGGQSAIYFFLGRPADRLR